jgi:hypothetical protein
VSLRKMSCVLWNKRHTSFLRVMRCKPTSCYQHIFKSSKRATVHIEVNAHEVSMLIDIVFHDNMLRFKQRGGEKR